MKIAMISQRFPLTSAPNGGVPAATYHLCLALSRQPDIELVIIRTLSDPEDLQITDCQGIQVVPLEYLRRFSKPLALLLLPLFQVRRALKRIKPDLIHVQDSSLLATCLPGPQVFTLHGQVEEDARLRKQTLYAPLRAFLLGLFFGWPRRWVRNVIAISPHSRTILKPGSPRRIWEIPNAISDDFFDLAPKHALGKTVIFSAAHVSRLKNTEALISALAVLAKTNATVELRVAGSLQEPDYHHSCLQLARELDVADRVIFLGTLDLPRLLEEMQRASVFALCSLRENAPMAVAEAMAAGVPVVASQVGGIAWMLDEGRAGLLVQNPRDPEAIATALCGALEPATHARLSREGRARAEMFRADRVAAQTVAVYREILQSHNRPLAQRI